MTNSYIVYLNGSGGAIVTVLAKRACYRYRVQESQLKADGTTANTPQGIIITDLTGTNRTPPITQAPVNLPAPSNTQEPSEYPYLEMPSPNDAQCHGGLGHIIAKGPDVTLGVGVVAALPLFQARSATAAATSVLVFEEGE